MDIVDKLKKDFSKNRIPDDLAYLEGEYREAYLHGIEECKIYVAKAYYFGYPVYIDKPKAYLLFKELSNNNNYEAMYYLAKMYENADTVEMDMNLAIKLLTESANHGNILAMNELIQIN